MSQEKQTGFIPAGVQASRLQACQGRAAGYEAFCCLHSPASRDGKHGGQVLVSLDGTAARLCFCVRRSAQSHGNLQHARERDVLKKQHLVLKGFCDERYE